MTKPISISDAINIGCAKAVAADPRHIRVPLPCPFCGEDPPLAAKPIGSQFRNYIVGCENEDCPANPQVSGETVNEAWARWNLRAPIPVGGGE